MIWLEIVSGILQNSTDKAAAIENISAFAILWLAGPDRYISKKGEMFVKNITSKEIAASREACID